MHGQQKVTKVYKERAACEIESKGYYYDQGSRKQTKDRHRGRNSRVIGSWVHFPGQFPTFRQDDSLIFFVDFPKLTFPESRFQKSPNPVSRSKLQSRISLPVFSKIPNPGLRISQIQDRKNPIGDPLHSNYKCLGQPPTMWLSGRTDIENYRIQVSFLLKQTIILPFSPFKSRPKSDVLLSSSGFQVPSLIDSTVPYP